MTAELFDNRQVRRHTMRVYEQVRWETGCIKMQSFFSYSTAYKNDINEMKGDV
jgi:hypothetical protein